MRISPRMRLLLACAILPLVAGCDDYDARAYFRDYPRPGIRPRGRPVEVRGVRQFGQAAPKSNAIWFATIVGIDARRDGSVLAVADPGSCSIALMDLQRRTMVRAGACGNGPGELSQLLADVAFHRDTVVATYIGRRGVSFFASDGRFVRTLRPLGDAQTSRITHVQPLDDSLFIAVYRRGPSLAKSGALQRHSIVLGTLGTGRVLASAIERPPLADNALGYRTPYVSAPLVCASPASSPPVVVAANRWSEQVVFLEVPSFALIANVASPIAWRTLYKRDDRPGEMRPPRSAVILTCGTDFVVLAYIQREVSPPIRTFPPPLPPPPPRPIVHARWDFYTYSGDLRYTIEDSLPNLGPDSMLVTTPGAMIGNRVYAYSNTLRDYPVVLEYTLEIPDSASFRVSQ